MKIEISRKNLLLLGLIVCKCGYPKNNHYNFGKKLCARTTECKGYKESIKYGKIIK